MASQDGYLRSNADKGESDPDNDLRLRSDANRIPAEAVYVGLYKINGMLLAEINSVNGVTINAFNNLEVPP